MARTVEVKNPYPASRMTSTERRSEVCAILARGLLRLRARRWDAVSGRTGDLSLPIPPDQSGHATPATPETA